jgi:hypothetical protein
MPATTLAPATPVSVSAEVRLAYVLQHFRLAYPSTPAIAIGYAGHQPQVEIAELSAGFFDANLACPAAPNLRDWLGRQVPFFFDNRAIEALIIFQPGKVFISADIISAAFYLLSGWQEYFSTERDRHGRFPYVASVQQKYNFVTVPVVNYYFDVLKTAVEYISNQPLRPRTWGSQQATFAAFISHDVDNLYSAWKAPAKAALQQRQLNQFGRLLWKHLTQPDAWDNLDTVAATTAQYGAESTFFLLPTKGQAADGTPNADYDLTALPPKFWRRLATHACTIDLHGSIGTATNAQKLMTEDAVVDALGVRFHYLRWDPAQTPMVVEESQFLFDSTLGFAEHFGFRHSYAQPFFPFNFELGRAAHFLEIPLNVMDATLHHPNYLQLQPHEILPALQPVFAEINRFGGVAAMLWHNENFDPANTRNGPQQFHEIMRHLQLQQVAFLTGREIWQEYAAENAHSISNS